jgi:EF-P beta-lysylation protein EpmB
LPKKQELKKAAGFVCDPLLEKTCSPIPGLIHKYEDRALLLVNKNCAINCRFCFRRHSKGKILNWDRVFVYLKNHKKITEIILSGGDPLMLPTKNLNTIIKSLSQIPHIKRLRIHTRLPIVMPEKIAKIKVVKTRLPIILVVHCNHPQEINAKVVHAINLLHEFPMTIFSQSVLLHNINDNIDTLISLSEKLFSIGIHPYYLHILDKVAGAKHFYVTRSKAKKLRDEMQKKLPGYLVPKFIVEIKNKKIYV